MSSEARDETETQIERHRMAGLEVARRFFEEWGLPHLRSEFPEVAERAACLLFGGSQSLGNDDDLSRDHGWGPEYSIVLTSDDMRRLGRRLRSEVDKAAPRQWLGHKFHWPATNVTVDSVDGWFRKNIGVTHTPKTLKGWGRIREADLYMLRHASVFHDPLGEFTDRRESFGFYPREKWLHRVAEETWDAWHYGQYNFLGRLSQRDDPIAVSVCLGVFIQSTMKLCMLLNGDFSPYWKWLPAEFRKQPNVADLASWLTDLATTHSRKHQADLVGRICEDLYARLVREGLVSEEPTGHPHPLYCANAELRKQIV